MKIDTIILWVLPLWFISTSSCDDSGDSQEIDSGMSSDGDSDGDMDGDSDSDTDGDSDSDSDVGGDSDSESSSETDSDTHSRIEHAPMTDCQGGTYDPDSKLCWQKFEGNGMNYEEAQAYCDGYKADGYKDWRLPTIGELRTLFRSGDAEKVCGTVEWDINWTKPPDDYCQVFDGCLNHECYNWDLCGYENQCGYGNNVGPGWNGYFWDPEMKGYATQYLSKSPVENFDGDRKARWIMSFSQRRKLDITYEDNSNNSAKCVYSKE